MTFLTDELLEQISKASSKPYVHEGRAMALELLEWRRKAREAAKAPPPTPPSKPGLPFPHGLYP